MKVLVACEYSAVVRDAFRAKGHDAWSCDLLPTEGDPAFHYQCDVLPLLERGWDLMVAHPPCTYLASSGARWWRGREDQQIKALLFVLELMNSCIPKVAIENPVGKISSHFRKPNQIIHPYMFGHTESKATCLWLKRLPPLQTTNNVKSEMLNLPIREQHKMHYLSPSADRAKLRSRTYAGIAEAMAEQWGASTASTV